MKGKFKTGDITNLRKNGCPMIIFIYSPGCGHCRNYEPDWDSHYDRFPEHNRNHEDTLTPSIGSISFEDLHNIPIQVRLGSDSKHRNLRDIVDFVPKMVSLDEKGVIHPISNIHDFDGIEKLLKGMGRSMSGGFLYSKTPSKTPSKSPSKTPKKSPTSNTIYNNVKKKKKKSKRKKSKKKRKSKRKRKKSRMPINEVEG